MTEYQKLHELAAGLGVAVPNRELTTDSYGSYLLQLIEALYDYTERLENRIAELEFPGMEYPGPGKARDDAQPK